MRKTLLAASLLLCAAPALAGTDGPGDGAVGEFGVAAGEAFLGYGGPGDRQAWEARLGKFADAESVRKQAAALDSSGNGVASMSGKALGTPHVAETAPGQWLVSYDAEWGYTAYGNEGGSELAMDVRVRRDGERLRVVNVIAK